MSNSLQLSDFAPDTTLQWRQRVEKELKGKSFEDFLVWKSIDGFQIEAWSNQLPGQLCQLRPLESPWKLLELVNNQDAQLANKSALHALMNGAEAVWFTKSFHGAAKEVATNGIDEKIAPVFISGNTICDPYHSLLKHGAQDEIKASTTQVINGHRLRERGCSVIQEIAFMLAQAIELCDTIGFDSSLYFKTGVGSGYLTETSKIRAIRWLWASALSLKNEGATNPSVIAQNLCIGYSKNDEHNNILRATTSALAGISGGAQFVGITPWDLGWNDSNEFSSRITRNIQNLLKDEARLSANLNPADGSFFIENLTTALAKKSWELVQTIIDYGGFSKYALDGKLAESIETERQRLVDAYKSQERILLNVNKYGSTKIEPENRPNYSSYKLLPDYLFLPTEIES